MNVIIHSDCIW